MPPLTTRILKFYLKRRSSLNLLKTLKLKPKWRLKSHLLLLILSKMVQASSLLVSWKWLTSISKPLLFLIRNPKAKLLFLQNNQEKIRQLTPSKYLCKPIHQYSHNKTISLLLHFPLLLSHLINKFQAIISSTRATIPLLIKAPSLKKDSFSTILKAIILYTQEIISKTLLPSKIIRKIPWILNNSQWTPFKTLFPP